MESIKEPESQEENKIDQNIQEIQTQEQQEIDRCRGCLLGAFIGDALGAVLEFKKKLTKQDVQHALTMPGGGLHKVGPGQITDDGELTIALARALVESKGKLNIDYVALNHGKWFVSKPFDVGNTIRRSVLKNIQLQQNQGYIARKGAQNKDSLKSQSNGSLMCHTPIAIWARNLKDEEIARYSKEITLLTHPNENCISANIVYSIMIKHLIKGKDQNFAFEAACKWSETNSSQEFKGWINAIKQLDISILPPANRKGGWVCIALSYSIYFLLKEYDFQSAMAEMLSLEGDTDTNCCIMGGLLGAKFGEKNIPDKYKQNVLNYDSSKGGQRRPNELIPKYCYENLIQGLIKYSPSTEFQIIGGSQQDIQFNYQK